MKPIQITTAIENEINLTEDAWLIINENGVAGVYSGKDAARRAKAENNLSGKIVDAAKCEFELVDSAPDETIAEEDEAELAAALEAEEAAPETITLTKRNAGVADVRVLLGAVDVMQSRVCPECGSEELYTGRSDGGLTVDEDYIIGCHHCDWEVDTRKQKKSTGVKRGRNDKQIEAAKTSKKLNRAVICVETSQQWDKVGDIHKNNPDLMSWGQCARVRKELYAAAKDGKLIDVKCNDKTYRLVSVE